MSVTVETIGREWLGALHQAVCDCGWSSTYQHSLAAAWADAEDHEQRCTFPNHTDA